MEGKDEKADVVSGDWGDGNFDLLADRGVNEEKRNRAAQSPVVGVANYVGGGGLRNDDSARLVAGLDAEQGAKSEYSPKPRKARSLKIKGEQSPCEIAESKVVDFAAFKAKVTIHSSAVFETKSWKRSRIKKGYLIRRIKGYDPVESEYGVHYLRVLSRRPKKTSGDCSLYEHAGFATWDVLQAGGRLVKERKKYERVSGDRANAS